MKVSTESVRFAVRVDKDGYPASLQLHKIYRVLPDEGVVDCFKGFRVARSSTRETSSRRRSSPIAGS